VTKELGGFGERGAYVVGFVGAEGFEPPPYSL
jgi:hypothetical protein